MEALTVTLEMAKKLKAAGFPQTAEFVWSDFTGSTGDSKALLVRERTSGGNDIAAAPTAQELADQLPDGYFALRDREGYSNKAGDWLAWETENGVYDKDGNELRADTMAEALALLWLKLEEAK